MKELDVRGFSCPEPMMLTEEAVKKGELPLQVLVSEPHQKENVMQVAVRHKKNATAEEKDGYYLVTIE